MIIRPASIEDSRGIAAVHVSSWRAAYRGIVPQTYLDQLSVADRQAGWVRLFEQGDSEVLLAEKPVGVIGFSSFGKSRDKGAEQSAGEIYAIYVDPEEWSAGVGYALFEHSMARLAVLGFSHASLWVFSANARAIQFYERIGFKVCAGSETMMKIGGEELEEVRYRIEIV